ncbi:MAG: hypothetical protein R3D57_16115 [Hyphomicrobiaceae bacterium]
MAGDLGSTLALLKSRGAQSRGADPNLLLTLERDVIGFAKRQALIRWRERKRYFRAGARQTLGHPASKEHSMTKRDDSLQAQMENIHRLQEEIKDLQQTAKEQLVAKANEVIADLNRMGHDYRLVQGSGRGAGRSAPRQSDPSRPCPVCRFRTVPFHDGRTHRSQGKNKKAFSAEELRSLGLKRA